MATKEDKQLDQSGNMEQIRELMFGPQTRMFEEEIAKINSNFNAMHTELIKRIESLESTLRSESDSAIQIVDQKIKNLTLATQDESSDFKEQLVKYEKKTNRGFDDVKEMVEVQLNTLKNDHNQNKTLIKKDLEALQTSLKELLNEQIEDLSDVKVSKDDFSAMLLEMAIKIKGSNLENSLESMLQEQKNSK